MAEQMCAGEARSSGVLGLALLVLSPAQGRERHGQKYGCMDGASWAPLTCQAHFQTHFLVGTVPGSEPGASAQAELGLENCKPLGLGCHCHRGAGWGRSGLEWHGGAKGVQDNTTSECFSTKVPAAALLTSSVPPT